MLVRAAVARLERGDDRVGRVRHGRGLDREVLGGDPAEEIRRAALREPQGGEEPGPEPGDRRLVAARLLGPRLEQGGLDRRLRHGRVAPVAQQVLQRPERVERLAGLDAGGAERLEEVAELLALRADPVEARGVAGPRRPPAPPRAARGSARGAPGEERGEAGGIPGRGAAAGRRQPSGRCEAAARAARSARRPTWCRRRSRGASARRDPRASRARRGRARELAADPLQPVAVSLRSPRRARTPGERAEAREPLGRNRAGERGRDGGQRREEPAQRHAELPQRSGLRGAGEVGERLLGVGEAREREDARPGLRGSVEDLGIEPHAQPPSRASAAMMEEAHGGRKEMRPRPAAGTAGIAPGSRSGEALTERPRRDSVAAMRALVTGAGGFLGSALVRALSERGDLVRALVRRPAETLALPGVEIATGDATDPAALRAAVRGCDVVFHLAGVRRATDAAEFLRVNAGSTRALLEACVAEAPGLSRFVLAGSLAAAGPSRTPRREEEPLAPVEPYGASKAEAERIALSFADAAPGGGGAPAAHHGAGRPREPTLLPDRAGRARACPSATAPLSWIDVDDCARGFLAAGRAARGRRRGLLPRVARARRARSGLMAEAARALGVRARRVPVPAPLLRAAARAADAVTEADRTAAAAQPEARGAGARAGLGVRPVEGARPARVRGPRRRSRTRSRARPRWYLERGWL